MADKTKVLILLHTVPHYFSPVLDRLCEFYDINVLMPSERDLSSGLNENEIAQPKYTTHQLPEFKTKYKKKFFEGFEEFVNELQPQIIISIWEYTLYFAFNKNFRKRLQNKNIKIVPRLIPFHLPPRKEWFSYYDNNFVFDQEKNRLFQGMKGKATRIFLYLMRTKRYYKSFDAFMVYNPSAIETIATYGVKKELVFPLTNGLDPHFYPEINDKNFRKDGVTSFLYVGRLLKWKNPEELIQAVLNLNEQGHKSRVEIVGEGHIFQQLKGKFGSHKEVVFHGGIFEKNALAKIYQNNDCMVMPGMGGLVINEAMIYGLPVIVPSKTSDGSIEYLVENDQNGYVFESENFEDLERRMKQICLMTNTQLEEISKNNLELIRRIFSYDNYISNFKKAINDIVNLD